MYQYTSANIVDKSSKLYEVLFDGTEGSSNGKSYWLASSGVVVVGSDDCGFGPGAVDEGGAGTGMVCSTRMAIPLRYGLLCAP